MVEGDSEGSQYQSLATEGLKYFGSAVQKVSVFLFKDTGKK